jgi:hypothetical protein
MARTHKLTDIQLVLLSTAAQRADGSLLPPPDSLNDRAAGIRKVVASLIKRGLAEEKEAAHQNSIWRVDGELRLGVFISPAGRAAIGLGDKGVEAADSPVPTSQVEGGSPSYSPREGSKQALILDLLRRSKGATLNELVTTTGWLPHTARAALTGLRKKGQTVVKAKRDGVTCYSIAKA